MFCIKKALMRSILEKRKKNNPFLYDKAEAYTLPTTDGDGTENNSYYFSAHDVKNASTLYVRLGLRDNGVSEVWTFFEADGKRYVHEKLYYSPEEPSPLSVSKSESGWSFTFDGTLTDENGKQVKAKLDCSFAPSGEPVDFFTSMPTVRMATAVAQDKWSKEYFAEMQKNNSVHYEQEGRILGTVKIANERYQVDMPALRDHSFGRRVWGYMNNHLWLAVADDECMLNFSLVSYPAMGVLEVGHLRTGNSVEFVTKAHYDRNQVVLGEIPPTLALTLTTDKGSKIDVQIKLLHAHDYVFEQGDYTLIEGVGEYTVDGKICRGIYEIGFNADKSRFMNGKKIDKIRE